MYCPNTRVPPAIRTAATLVKLLALAPGHRVERDQVLDVLWPDDEPKAVLVLGQSGPTAFLHP